MGTVVAVLTLIAMAIVYPLAVLWQVEELWDIKQTWDFTHWFAAAAPAATLLVGSFIARIAIESSESNKTGGWRS